MSIRLELIKLKDRILRYKLKPGHSPEILKWMQELSQAMEKDISAKDLTTDELQMQIIELTNEMQQMAEVIKKQALLIESANIVYPTINQSTQSIWECYLASKGRSNEIGLTLTPKNIQIKVI